MQFACRSMVVRGKKVITTNSDATQPCPDDKVNREFVAAMPNQLCPLIDTAYRLPGNRCRILRMSQAGRAWSMSPLSSTSLPERLSAPSRQICCANRLPVNGRVSTSMTTGFVLDALNQAICQRVPSQADGLTHHSDRGSQYLSIKYTERLTDAGIDPSVGSVGDSYPSRDIAAQYPAGQWTTRWPKASLAYSKPR